MNVVLTPQAEKDLQKMDAEIRKRFARKIDDIRQDRAQIEQLQHEPPRWKVRNPV